MTDNQAELAKRAEQALEHLIDLGQCDGAHHKAWVIDQAIRILAADEYKTIVAEYCNDGEYEWDEGITP